MLVVRVMERPAVATIETHGIKAFDKDAVEKSLRDVGMAEGRIFDQATLERADQELRRQYLARGYYGVTVKTTVTPLERNRVRLTMVAPRRLLRFASLGTARSRAKTFST